MNKKKASMISISIFSVLVLIAIDQLTKYAAVCRLKGTEGISIIKGVFDLLYLENHGAAFGVLEGKKVFFLAITFLFLVLLTWFFLRIPMQKHFCCLRVITVVLFAGAAGNLIDRIAHNYVVDFFYFKLIHFPVFNVADIYVTVSCALLILTVFFYYKEEDFEQIFPSGKKKDSAHKRKEEQ